MPQQIGTVTLVRDRAYPASPGGDLNGPTVLVKKGTYPAYRSGKNYFWAMRGRPNTVRADSCPVEGSELFIMSRYDRPSGKARAVLSPSFDERGFRHLVSLSARSPERGLIFDVTL